MIVPWVKSWRPLGWVLLVLLVGALWLWPERPRPEWQLPEPPANLEPADAATLPALEAVQRELQTYRTRLAQPVESLPAVSPERRQELAVLTAQAARQSQDLSGLRATYLQVRRLWHEEAVRSLLTIGSTPNNVEPPPPFEAQLYYRLPGNSLAQAYRQSYQEAMREYGERQELIHRRQREALQSQLDWLIAFNALRHSCLLALDRLGYVPSLDSGTDYWSDVSLELSAIPFRYRVRYLKMASEVIELLEQGYPGRVVLARRAGFLVLCLVVPWVLLGVQRSASRALRRHVEGRPLAERSALKTLLLDLLPWLVLILGLELERQFLAGTGLDFLVEPLQIVIFYAGYRVYLLTALFGLRRWVFAAQPDQPAELLAKGSRSVREVGRFGLFCGVVLSALMSATNVNLVYLLTARLLKLAGLVVYIHLCWSWAGELADYWGVRRWRRVFALLLAPLTLARQLVTSLASWVSQYEWGKRLSAGLLRHYLVRVAASEKLGPVPADYRRAFSEAPKVGEYPSVERTLSALSSAVEARLTGDRRYDGIVLTGPKGVGFTHLLETIAAEFAERIPVVWLNIPERNLEPASFLALAEERLHGLGRALVLMRGAHNLFLSRVGGFAACQAATELIRTSPEQIWLYDLPEHCFDYLQRVFANEPFALQVVRAQLWTERELASLILGRHQATGYGFRLSQALFRQAEDPERAQAVQDLYFRLLWEQSGGNPSTACELWLRSLSLSQEDPRCLVVGLPTQVSGYLSDVPDDFYFVCAALVRHRSLSVEEAAAATNLPEKVARFCLHQAHQWGVLTEVDGSYEVHPGWTTEMTRVLRRRNLLGG